MVLPRLSVIVVTGFLAACMSQQDLSGVESAVDEFHELQARGDDAAIYRTAAADFRNAATLEDLARINNAVRNATGCSERSRNPSSWNNNVSTSGQFITVVYNRTCSGGPLAETFVFRMTAGDAQLAGYTASGLALFPAAPAQAPETVEKPQAEQPAASSSPEAEPAAAIMQD
jgi:hypothetical protein